MFAPGDVVAGKYRVLRVLGEGGMGVVLAAHHLGLDETVALKLIRSDRALSPTAIERFQREARAAARLKSEHVARVLDVDRLPDGAPYIVLEYIEGTDLHAVLHTRGPLDVASAVSFIAQACEGVAEAHARGIVHRDIKLKNLFLTKRPDGRPLVKVIDFGIVKFVGDTSSSSGGALAGEATSLTSGSMLVGSLHYMAPEQIVASNVVDARADVWSLGVCLFALLTGSLPFQGIDAHAVWAAIQSAPAPDLRESPLAIPPGLARVVARALEKDVRLRFANVAELARELAAFGSDPELGSRVRKVLTSAANGTAPVVTPHAPERSVTGRLATTQAEPLAADTLVASSVPASAAPERPRRTRFAMVASLFALGLVAAASAAIAIAPSRTARSSSPGTPAVAAPTSNASFSTAVSVASVASVADTPATTPTATTPTSPGVVNVTIDSKKTKSVKKVPRATSPPGAPPARPNPYDAF